MIQMTGKPLDFEFEREIYEKIKKHIRKNFKAKDFADEWIEIFEQFESVDSEVQIVSFIINEIKQRINSAVQGLLKDIEKEKRIWKNSNQEIENILEWCIEKIKKWFPIEEGGEE